LPPRKKLTDSNTFSCFFASVILFTLLKSMEQDDRTSVAPVARVGTQSAWI
jgi:hypothetical protein